MSLIDIGFSYLVLVRRTLPKIAEDDMEAVFYELDDSGDFKVRLHPSLSFT